MSNMVVRTNMFSLNAHRNMKNTGLEQGSASNSLSSGFRINSAEDDAAGLAITENMRTQIRGLDQAWRNAQDGIALIQTAEGGMNEISDMVKRIRELVVQAANDTYIVGQRSMIQEEINQLVREIDSISGRIEYNGMVLFNGSAGWRRVPAFAPGPLPPPPPSQEIGWNLLMQRLGLHDAGGTRIDADWDFIYTYMHPPAVDGLGSVGLDYAWAMQRNWQAILECLRVSG